MSDDDPALQALIKRAERLTVRIDRLNADRKDLEKDVKEYIASQKPSNVIMMPGLK